MLVFLCNTLESDLERFPDAMPGPKPPTRGGGACWHHYGADGPGSVVLLNADQLDSRLAELPVNANWPIPEARVIEWKTGTDKSPLGYATYFPPNPSYAEAPEEEIYGEIKIGGLPHWIQERGRHLYPYPAWQFVLQIPDRYRMAGKPPPADRLGGDIDFFDKKGHHLHREKTSFSKNYSFWDTSAKKDEPYWEVFFHCFGAGKGYVLLHREEGNRHLPVGKFFFDR